MLVNDLISILNNELAIDKIKDYCPNGWQVEGKKEVKKIVTGVTASQALINEAIALGADAILVHHGYFWKGEKEPIVGMKKARIKALLQHDINLLAYHLPLDVHPSLGNNAQLGKILGLENITAIDAIHPVGIVMSGNLPKAQSHQAFCDHLSTVLKRNITSIGTKELISTIAWCTGGGQNFIDEVASSAIGGRNIDAYLSGEISEQTTHSAIEQSIDYFAAGHHATERYGVKSLGEFLASNYDLSVTFVDIDNPA